MTAPDPSLSLVDLYENALREIVEAAGSEQPDIAQVVLELAADALAHGGEQ